MMPAPRTPGPDHPSAPGVYECLRGGHDYFPADAALVEHLLKEYPGVRELARVNRQFVVKAARWAASHLKISQFIDLGCGYPAKSRSVHSVAREMEPGSRVAYVDIHPVVVSHVRAAADAEGWGPGIAVIEGDASDPAAVLDDPSLRGLIDLSLPACLIFGGTLSDMDADAARKAVAGFTAEMAPGSCAIISCVVYADQELGERVSKLFSAAGAWQNHSPDEVASFFGGLRLIHGRIMNLACWPACEASGEPETADAIVLGGIGVKP